MQRPAIQRMSGFDGGYFYSESAKVHQHIMVTVIIEPNEAVTFETFVAGVLGRLRSLPPLRRRTVHVPFRLHHPVWVTLPRVDAAHHFRSERIGGTGGRRDLDALVGTIASTRLDARHPLWELHYCEGLADGRVAVVAKMHHSLADGSAINALLGNVVDVPEGSRPPAPEHATVARLPGRLILVRDALRDAVHQLRLLPALLLRTVRGLRAAGRHQRLHQMTVPKPILSSPRVSFNGGLTARREIATASIPMADFKTIRAQYDDITLNDLVLGAVSGSLRRWLELRGEQPSRPLTACIPVSLDDPSGPVRLTGNLLSNVFATLATDVADPAERLRLIATTMRHAKELNDLKGTTMLMDMFQFAPAGPVALAVRAHAGLRLPALLNAPFSLGISNLKGPQQPVAVGPARISDLYMIGPLVQSTGIGVMVWSYVDRMNFSLIACPDLFPDVEVLASYLPAALAEYARASA
jgi:diacylglycerol O-acyltransferase